MAMMKYEDFVEVMRKRLGGPITISPVPNVTTEQVHFFLFYEEDGDWVPFAEVNGVPDWMDGVKATHKPAADNVDDENGKPADSAP
jgi:hypothetical protein